MSRQLCSAFVRLRFGLLLAVCVGLTTKGWGAPPRRQAAGQRTAILESIDWSRALCPVTREPAAPAFRCRLAQGWIAFSCQTALDEYLDQPSDHLPWAHRQLAETGQYRQKHCPQSGRRHSPFCYLSVEGIDLRFADAQARNEFLLVPPSDRLERVFGAKEFPRHFEWVPLEDRPAAVEHHPLAARRRADDPRTEAHVAAIQGILAPAMQAQDRNWHHLMAPAGVIGHTASMDDNGRPIIRLLLKKTGSPAKAPDPGGWHPCDSRRRGRVLRHPAARR